MDYKIHDLLLLDSSPKHLFEFAKFNLNLYVSTKD